MERRTSLAPYRSSRERRLSGQVLLFASMMELLESYLPAPPTVFCAYAFRAKPRAGHTHSHGSRGDMPLKYVE
jgi:hypothetical protein